MTTNAGEGVGKRCSETLITALGHVPWSNHHGNHFRGFQKAKTRSPYDLAIQSLDAYPKDFTSYCIDYRTAMFISALFTISRKWNRSK